MPKWKIGNGEIKMKKIFVDLVFYEVNQMVDILVIREFLKME